jgi:hypothetical protein
MYTMAMESEFLGCRGLLPWRLSQKQMSYCSYLFLNPLFSVNFIFSSSPMCSVSTSTKSEGYHVVISSNILVNKENPVGKQTVPCLVNSPSTSVGNGRHTKIDNTCYCNGKPQRLAVCNL